MRYLALICALLLSSMSAYAQQTEFISIRADHANASYTEGERAVFLIYVLTKPTNPEFSIELEASFPNSSSIVPLDKIGEIFSYITPALTSGTKTFSVKVFLSKGVSRTLVQEKSVQISIAASQPSISMVVPNSVREAMYVGQTRQLSAKAYQSVETPLTGAPVSWRSLSPAIASVDQSGLVTGVADGRAQIVATVYGVDSVPVSVHVASIGAAPSVLIPDDYFSSYPLARVRGSLASLNPQSSTVSSLLLEGPAPIDGSSFVVPVGSIPGQDSHPITVTQGQQLFSLDAQFKTFGGKGNYFKFKGAQSASVSFTSAPFMGFSPSISLWIKPGMNTGKFMTIPTAVPNQNWEFKLGPNFEPIFKIADSQSPSFVIGSPNPDKNWTHLAVTYNEITRVVSLFQDGILRSQAHVQDLRYPVASKAFQIGGEASFSIDELRFWNDELSASDVMQDRFDHPVNFSSRAAALFTFDGASDQTIADTTGHGALFTLGTSANIEASDPLLTFAPTVVANPTVQNSTGATFNATFPENILIPGLTSLSFDINHNSFSTSTQELTVVLDDRGSELSDDTGESFLSHAITVFPTNIGISDFIRMAFDFNAQAGLNAEEARLMHIYVAEKKLDPFKPSLLTVSEPRLEANLRTTGTFVLLLNKGQRPDVLYSSPLFSEQVTAPFPYERSLAANITIPSGNPLEATVTGNTDGAVITSATCNGVSKPFGPNLPITFTSLNSGANACTVIYEKPVGTYSYFLEHYFAINIQ